MCAYYAKEICDLDFVEVAVLSFTSIVYDREQIQSYTIRVIVIGYGDAVEPREIHGREPYTLDVAFGDLHHFGDICLPQRSPC